MKCFRADCDGGCPSGWVDCTSANSWLCKAANRTLLCLSFSTTACGIAAFDFSIARRLLQQAKRRSKLSDGALCDLQYERRQPTWPCFQHRSLAIARLKCPILHRLSLSWCSKVLRYAESCLWTGLSDGSTLFRSQIAVVAGSITDRGQDPFCRRLRFRCCWLAYTTHALVYGQLTKGQMRATSDCVNAQLASDSSHI